MTPLVGIDFGTTNSAVAVIGDDGNARLAPLPGIGGSVAPTWRTVLYFEPPEDGGPPAVSAGAPAIDRYLETEGQGRFVQSIKSHLASALFSGTTIFGRRHRIEDLITTYLVQLRAAVKMDLGRRAVVGRPVRYWGADDAEDDARAVERMQTALGHAGFEETVLEYEPVAAARHYSGRLDHDELVLIADLGGGTTDFSLIRVGPSLGDLGDRAVLATGGIGVGGDAFDGRLIDQVVAPLLGKGTSYEAEFGRRMPVPPWIYSRLRRWHHLSFLRSADTTALLLKIEAGAADAQAIRRLMRVVDDELGLPLHQSIERTKVALSAGPEAGLSFDPDGVALQARTTRADFDRWIDEDLCAIDDVVTTVLERAAVGVGDVDRVFATGGSSFVPAVRTRLRSRFGADRVVGGDELTSVATGLAEAARLRFGS